MSMLPLRACDIDAAIEKFELAYEFDQHISFDPAGALAMLVLLRAMKAEILNPTIQQFTVEQVLGWDKEAGHG